MSSTHKNLKYRTFDALMADVASDFKKYQLQNILDPQDMIKVARKVNYELGLRINMTHEEVLEVEKNKAKMPNDFYTLNFALMLGSYDIKQYLPQGTHIEERPVGIPTYQPIPPEQIDFCNDVTLIEPALPCDPQTNPCCANPGSCMLTCDDNVVQLIQKTHYETRHYRETFPLRISKGTEKLNKLCPNRYWDSPMTAYIEDGWLHTSFITGKVYLNYEGDMEDKEGNLLVLDHPVINEYYEYALKQRIIENLIMNDEQVSQAKVQLIEARVRPARNNALSIVNTPDFKELRDLYQANRNAMYGKYYDMFAKTPRLKIR